MNAPIDNPAGRLLVSDADRDQALAELSEAFQAGRITAEELDQRSGQILTSRTRDELAAPLADLPAERGPAGRGPAARPAAWLLATRITVAASAVAAMSLIAVALANALGSGSGLGPARKQQIASHVLRGLGLHARVCPAPRPGFNWAGTVTPAAFAAALVALIIFLLVAGPGLKFTKQVQ